MGKIGICSTEWKCVALGVCTLGLTIFLFLVLFTDGFVADGQPGRPLDGMTEIPNLFGPPGAVVAGALAFLFGDASHVLYAVTFLWTLMLFSQMRVDRLLRRVTGMLVLAGAAGALLQLNLSSGGSNPQAGGAFGAFLSDGLLLPRFGWTAANVLGLFIALIGLLLATDLMFFQIVWHGRHAMAAVTRAVVGVAAACVGMSGGYRSWRTQRRIRRAQARVAPRPSEEFPLDEPPEVEPTDVLPKFPPLAAPAAARPAVAVEPPRIHLPEPLFQDEDEVLPVPPRQPAKGRAPAAPRPAARPLPLLSDAKPSPFDDTLAGVEAAPPVPAVPAAVFAGEAEDDLFGCSPFEEEARKSAELLRDAADRGDAPHVRPEPAPAAPELPVFPAGRKAAPAVSDVSSQEAARAVRPAPRPRRKTLTPDEVPDDYVYPKKYAKPPLDLFERAVPRMIPNLREKLGRMSQRLEETLRTFGIEAHVTDVTRGPTVTRFELEPAPGIKVSRFLALTDDIALALEARGVRVEAPIPGRARVGIEVSNEERDPVMIRELLEHPHFGKGHNGRLNLALGKGISGEVCIADLARMPHLLVAGATGAGKTVCVKSLLASLLLQHTPDELQLMLIDPKMVELSIFNDIPHLITPVVTDAKKAATALTWLINEMEERYQLFADLRVRNIEIYNESVENGSIEMIDGEGQSLSVVRRLPYIVCIIDELADLMMLARAEVEDAIARLAQLARAVGIHLIIATQRPSVDVLTGVIKANFPARISFQVSSRVDSRCILDEIGAERLVGQGDMLYLPAGQSKPDRIQGAFVSDEEMAALIAYLKRQAPPQYRDEIENFGKSKDSLAELAEEDDPLFEDAVRVVLETGQASISMVQRRLRVGYTRAARLIDMMELRGIVGPHTGSKAREILVDPGPRDDVA